MFHAMWLGEVTIRHRQALYLLFLVNQCLKRNSFTISSSAALSCRPQRRKHLARGLRCKMIRFKSA